MAENENGMQPALANIQEYRLYLKDITAIQAESVRRLVETDGLPPLEMAAVLEDIANKFLDMSDDIREFAMNQSADAQGSATLPPGEAAPN
jgi:hypothetical protein